MAAATTPRATTPQLEPFPPLDPAPPTSTTAGVLFSRNKSASKSPSNVAHPLRPLPALNLATDAAGGLSPKSKQPGLSPRVSPVQLTGQAAQAEMKRRKLQPTSHNDRQTSPNPAVVALQKLVGGASDGLSRPSDAPAPDKLSEPLRQAAASITMPEIQDGTMQTSPVSMSSFGTIESTGPNTALTATASSTADGPSHFVAEPAEMENNSVSGSHNGHLVVAGEDGNSKSSFSYPGLPQHDPPNHGVGPSRGMSLPGYGQNSPQSPASTSNKRHKCPYCSTDFTRHHNLKSHLLTHSQEKPYVCQTCQARFRRLHDLKRHTKLHTGERPHTCDKCGRRFARGDALARHNKGPGGCAGRRSSFGGDDEFGDGDGMDGVEYTGGDEDDDADNPRRVSEPSRKRALDSQDPKSREVYRQHSSTYPPPQQGRPHGSSVSSMGPPQVVHPAPGQASSPRDLSNQLGPAYYQHTPGGQVLGQQNMIESPKPLSPGQPPDQHRLSVGDASIGSLRNRSPSLTTQFQQQHFGRGSGGRTPPQPGAPFGSGQQLSHAPVLPPLHGGQPTTRPSLQPSSVPTGVAHHPQTFGNTTGQQGSNPSSLSSHGRSSGSSLRDITGQDQSDIWSYVRSLEQKFSRMQDEYELRISRLQEEVISLKGQMSAAASYSSDMNQQRY